MASRGMWLTEHRHMHRRRGQRKMRARFAPRPLDATSFMDGEHLAMAFAAVAPGLTESTSGLASHRASGPLESGASSGMHCD